MVTQTYKDAVLAIATGTGTPTVPDFQATDLDQAGFAALEWTSVSNVGNLGAWLVSQNILQYDTLDTNVAQKQGGIRNAGDPEIECARTTTDDGQNAMLAASDSSLYAAFRITLANGDILYSRGKVTGGRGFGGGGGVEDFVVRQFQIGLVQTPVEA